jgi:hypothetical protein
VYEGAALWNSYLDLIYFCGHLTVSFLYEYDHAKRVVTRWSTDLCYWYLTAGLVYKC